MEIWQQNNSSGQPEIPIPFNGKLKIFKRKLKGLSKTNSYDKAMTKKEKRCLEKINELDRIKKAIIYFDISFKEARDYVRKGIIPSSCKCEDRYGTYCDCI